MTIPDYPSRNGVVGGREAFARVDSMIRQRFHLHGVDRPAICRYSVCICCSFGSTSGRGKVCRIIRKPARPAGRYPADIPVLRLMPQVCHRVAPADDGPVRVCGALNASHPSGEAEIALRGARVRRVDRRSNGFLKARDLNSGDVLKKLPDLLIKTLRGSGSRRTASAHLRDSRQFVRDTAQQCGHLGLRRGTNDR